MAEIISINQVHISDMDAGDLKYSTKLKISVNMKYTTQHINEETNEIIQKIEYKDEIVYKTLEEVYLLSLSTGYKVSDEIKQTYRDHILETTRIHIRLQQRTARKFYTICEGIPQSINFNRVLNALRQCNKCNGNISKDKFGNTVIQLQGNQVENVAKFFEINELCDKDNIIIHGR